MRTFYLSVGYSLFFFIFMASLSAATDVDRLFEKTRIASHACELNKLNSQACVDKAILFTKDNFTLSIPQFVLKLCSSLDNAFCFQATLGFVSTAAEFKDSADANLADSILKKCPTSEGVADYLSPSPTIQRKRKSDCIKRELEAHLAAELSKARTPVDPRSWISSGNATTSTNGSAGTNQTRSGATPTNSSAGDPKDLANPMR